MEAISEDTAAVIINSPCNPTGGVYDSSEVCAMIEEAAAHDAYVIVDEIYEGLLYEGDPTSIAAQTEYSDHVLTVNGCSKKYAMTGWRVGWLAGSEGVIGPATKLHESTTSCASTMSQNAAVAALTGDQSPIRTIKSAFRERRDYVVERIEDLPVVTSPTPEGAFYAFLDVSGLDGSSMEIVKRLLYDYGVVTALGIGFSEYTDDFVRISFANNVDRLEVGFDRIDEMVRDSGGH
jgi:aspartate aminotransferase